ncbi:Phosphoenolpyruvate carboxykinase [GTP] [subsurface metagenome]|nr:phosphoenolpyruvate carboxykinase (GTP) [Clostridia bacterium]
MDTTNLFKTRLSEKDFGKLARINNPKLLQFVAKYIELCNPDTVFICTDSAEDRIYIEQEAIRTGEERMLAVPGQTVHFDGYYDQARDKKNTKFFLSEGVDLSSNLNLIDKQKGLKEINTIFKDIMKGHKLYVLFFCLGPCGSEFSIPCIQLTDSPYVAHSEQLLYRAGYEEFVRLGPSDRFFKFVHSEGELENNVSKNIEKRRIYIDTEEDIVYSMNTQYGGNTIGLKKLAMRLAISLASKEGWLTEHMFIMGVHGPNNRTTYFTGAFPSLCGKTATALLENETVVGDDIAYLRNKDGMVRAVNVEKGIFGIIQNVNSVDDPVLWGALNSPGQIIFSNVLVTEEGGTYWIGKEGKVPQRGINYSGEWTPGKKDTKGREIKPSHPNARFTVELKLLKNMDAQIDNPEGVAIKGIVYGGRDHDTWVPVEESFDWVHGIITKGACLESETTAATLGKEGVRKHNPMANLDFLSIPIAKYVQDNLNFGKGLKNPPTIFSVNYFLRDANGEFLNSKADKKVWLKWMELRVHKEVEAVETSTGLIPKYQDLKRLFKEVLNKDYSEDSYKKQFTLKVKENLAKIDRLMNIYKKKVPNTPHIVFKVLEEQKQRLNKAKNKK